MYKIIKKNKNWKKCEIERMSPTVFTVEQADNNAKDYEKYVREWTAQIKLLNAVIENVRRNHPEVYGLTRTQKEAARILVVNEEEKRKYKEKLAEVKEALKKWGAEKELLMKTFKWQDEK
jgi:hypothetical protein